MSSADKMLARLEDDVNQDVFWDGLTMQLTKSTKALRSFSAGEMMPQEVNKLIDYDMFLKLPMMEIVNIDATEVDECLPPNGLEVELTNTLVAGSDTPFIKKRLIKAPDRYMWLATRGMMPIEGTFSLGLDRVNSFRVEDVGKTAPPHA